VKIKSNIHVFLVNDSIWYDCKQLDFIGLSLKNNFTLKFFLSQPKTHSIADISFSSILKYCQEHNISRLGLIHDIILIKCVNHIFIHTNLCLTNGVKYSSNKCNLLIYNYKINRVNEFLIF